MTNIYRQRKFLRPAKIAEKIGIGESTLWRWLKEGRLPPLIRIGPRVCGMWDEDVETFIEQQRDEAHR